MSVQTDKSINHEKYSFVRKIQKLLVKTNVLFTKEFINLCQGYCPCFERLNLPPNTCDGKFLHTITELTALL